MKLSVVGHTLVCNSGRAEDVKQDGRVRGRSFIHDDVEEGQDVREWGKRFFVIP